MARAPVQGVAGRGGRRHEPSTLVPSRPTCPSRTMMPQASPTITCQQPTIQTLVALALPSPSLLVGHLAQLHLLDLVAQQAGTQPLQLQQLQPLLTILMQGVWLTLLNSRRSVLSLPLSLHLHRGSMHLHLPQQDLSKHPPLSRVPRCVTPSRSSIRVQLHLQKRLQQARLLQALSRRFQKQSRLLRRQSRRW